MKENIDQIHISEIVHKCFSNNIFIKTEQVQTRFLRLIAETPEEVIRGQVLFEIENKKDMKAMNEKRDELYRYFYKKIMDKQKK